MVDSSLRRTVALGEGSTEVPAACVQALKISSSFAEAYLRIATLRRQPSQQPVTLSSL